MIASLKEAGERIDQVSCGFAHVLALSTLGKIFSWGWGMKGQLGHNNIASELAPRQIADLAPERGPKKSRILSVAAGYSHSVVLNDAREVLWFGTNQQLIRQSKPIKAKLTSRFPDLFPAPLPVPVAPTQDFAVVRVHCAWSKLLSVTYFTIADLRSLNSDLSVNKLYSLIQTVAAKSNNPYCK